MIRRFLCFFMFFFLIVAFILYFMGVREINLFNGSQWMRGIIYRFSSLNGVRVSQIPEWTVVLGSNPSFWEEISYYLTFVVNFFIGLYNVIISLLNFAIDVVKVIIAIIWTVVESPELLVQ